MDNKKRAQSGMEYIILLCAFIVVLIVFLSPGGVMHNSILGQVNKAVDQIGTMAEETNFLNFEVEY
ncbi:MAG: hypothetical protein P9M07_05930 [Candidatus Aceula meridiana]|nr:hypothetical protein [Candidatus Aceula meridiana]